MDLASLYTRLHHESKGDLWKEHCKGLQKEHQAAWNRKSAMLGGITQGRQQIPAREGWGGSSGMRGIVKNGEFPKRKERLQWRLWEWVTQTRSLACLMKTAHISLRENQQGSISQNVAQIRTPLRHQDIPRCVLQGLKGSHGDAEISAFPCRSLFSSFSTHLNPCLTWLVNHRGLETHGRHYLKSFAAKVLHVIWFLPIDAVCYVPAALMRKHSRNDVNIKGTHISHLPTGLETQVRCQLGGGEGPLPGFYTARVLFIVKWQKES